MQLLDQFFSSPSEVDKSINFARHSLESRRADQAYECDAAWQSWQSWQSWQLGSPFFSGDIQTKLSVVEDFEAQPG